MPPLVDGYVAHYDNVRLNSAIGYITPKDMLTWRQQEIRRAGSEAAGGAKTAADSMAADRVKNEEFDEILSLKWRTLVNATP